jgi:methionyl-tRNA formyltransferase
MSKVRICFLGTSSFSVTCLKALVSDEHYEIVGVITQPDRPAGRKMLLTPSAVKTYCLSEGLRVISPESLKKETYLLDEIRKWKAEVAVVVAFGQILTEEFLNIFPLGAVNVHASLLPRWRGAAPIQRSIQFGDEFTGVSLQKVVKKLDAGDVLGERRIHLDSNINSLELHDRLAILGTELLHVEFMDYVRGNLTGLPQNEQLVTHAAKISNAESELKPDLTVMKAHNQVRAFVWGPGSFFTFENKKLKIYQTQIPSGETQALLQSVSQKLNSADSHFIFSERLCFARDLGSLYLNCQDGWLELLVVQPESKTKMSALDFARGYLQ